MDNTLTDNPYGKKLSSEYKSEIPNEVIEAETKKIPNLLFLGLGLASMAVSAILTANKRETLGTFVGQWVPTLLIFGVYNKIVKIEDEILKGQMH